MFPHGPPNLHLPKKKKDKCFHHRIDSLKEKKIENETPFVSPVAPAASPVAVPPAPPLYDPPPPPPRGGGGGGGGGGHGGGWAERRRGSARRRRRLLSLRRDVAIGRSPFSRRWRRFAADHVTRPLGRPFVFCFLSACVSCPVRPSRNTPTPIHWSLNSQSAAAKIGLLGYYSAGNTHTR